MGSHPSDGAGHVALDGAPRASADLLHTLRRIRWSAGTPRILGALDRIRALEVRLSAAALSSADEKSGTTSDTQFAWRPSRSASSVARITSTAGPSRRVISCDSGCLPSTSVRSDSPLARGFLGREPRTGLSGFAARIRLPTLLRSLLRREGARPSALVRSSRTRAFGHAPLVDFCNQNDPQARPTESGVLGSTWPSSLARRR
jgi:hypothetical protein